MGEADKVQFRRVGGQVDEFDLATEQNKAFGVIKMRKVPGWLFIDNTSNSDWELPHERVAFTDVEVPRYVKKTHGSVDLPDGRTWWIPSTDTGHFRDGLSSHVLRGGERLAIPLPGVEPQLRKPSYDDCLVVGRRIWDRIDHDVVMFPRMLQLLDMFGDFGTTDLNVPGEKKDVAWNHRFHEQNYGGQGPTDPPDWYRTGILIDSPGLQCNRYEQLLWHAMKFCGRGQQDLDFAFGLQLALWTAAFGVIHSGDKFTGAWYYENGPFGLVGGNSTSTHPKWEKQFPPDGLLAWHYLLPTNELIKAAVNEKFDYIRRETDDPWRGSGGARIGALYLESLRSLYENTREEPIKERARAQIKAYLTPEYLKEQPFLCWPNQQNGPAYLETSPWMNSQVAAAILRWHKYHHIVEEADVERTLEVVCSIVDNGMYETVDGALATRYRMIPQQLAQNYNNNSFMIQMLRLGAEFGPGLVTNFGALKHVYYRVRNHLWTTVGTSIGEPLLPIEDLGYRIGSQGVGWRKSAKTIMGSMKV